MSTYSFESVENIYSCSEKAKVKVHSVASSNLQTYSWNVSRFLKALNENGQDNFWIPIIYELKKFKFDLSAAPLSHTIISNKATKLSELLKIKIHNCELVYSEELAILLKQLAEQAYQLSKTQETNLLDFLTNLVLEETSGNDAVAICTPRLIPVVEESFYPIAGLSKCNIISPANLKDKDCYSRLFIIGAPRWFPEFVLSSPRSDMIHVVKHKWISGNWNPESVLISTYKSHNKSRGFKIEDDTNDFAEENPELLIPKINIKNIQDRATEELVNIVNDEDEIVVARLFLLESDWAVFLEADDDTSIDIIDLDEEITKRVRREKIGEIQPGVFILLRTEGGGDYIVPVADRLMGKASIKAREDQKRWKNLLREQVKMNGKPRVIKELQRLGSTRAENMNVDHWMSYRGIRTGYYEDHLAIMKLIGLEKEAEKYWDTMNVIRTAHTKAGFSIRAMLIDLVNKSNLDILKHHGKMDFELAEEGAGSLSAFRVIGVAEDTTEVIHWRIGEPFRIDNG